MVFLAACAFVGTDAAAPVKTIRNANVVKIHPETRFFSTGWE
jgi:hypothetical protein